MISERELQQMGMMPKKEDVVPLINEAQALRKIVADLQSERIRLLPQLAEAREVIEYYESHGAAMASGECIEDGGDKARVYLEKYK